MATIFLSPHTHMLVILALVVFGIVFFDAVSVLGLTCIPILNVVVRDDLIAAKNLLQFSQIQDTLLSLATTTTACIEAFYVSKFVAQTKLVDDLLQVFGLDVSVTSQLIDVYDEFFVVSIDALVHVIFVIFN